MNESKKGRFVELSQAQLKLVGGGSTEPQPWVVVGTTPIVVGKGTILKPPAVTDPQPW